MPENSEIRRERWSVWIVLWTVCYGFMNCFMESMDCFMDNAWVTLWTVCELFYGQSVWIVLWTVCGLFYGQCVDCFMGILYGSDVSPLSGISGLPV